MQVKKMLDTSILVSDCKNKQHCYDRDMRFLNTGQGGRAGGN